jgi:hypothetical protein
MNRWALCLIGPLFGAALSAADPARPPVQAPGPDQAPELAGGWASVPPGEARVQAAAEHAVAAQSAATGMALRLEAISEARAQVVAGMNYELQLRVLKDGRPHPASALVWARLDGSYQLTHWSWTGE